MDGSARPSSTVTRNRPLGIKKRAHAHKLLAAVIGEKRPKAVRLTAFAPSNEFIWEAADIDAVAGEFRDYLRSVWEDGCYLKLEE
jgi:hypothetical protein